MAPVRVKVATGRVADHRRPGDPVQSVMPSVAVESLGTATLVRPTGRLDTMSTVELRSRLGKVIAEQPAGIAVDLAWLTVEGDVPLTLFLALARAAAEPAGCPMVLCAPSARLRTALHRLRIGRVCRCARACGRR